MQILNSTKVKSSFARIGRDVVKGKSPVIVRFPFGFMKMERWEVPEEVPPVAPGTVRRSKREIELGNTLGDSL
ncbi:MAG TPA: hypothetical protein PLV33_12170 [Opitutaceae bacterium]|jgi:hypothetical protein|nr:MAG: hypothetical protein BWX86_01108 [Verrucomicrobia bacterium ADurb.Bin122]HOD48011.1 hypothetical protein [Opitutaceae bacterium]HOF10742.1 hypothetical protein [Opitutaceae bacterium]HOR26101.1 hypothetical protein [Opitutaceae bacterium]HPK49916.1 hypothetical protein [Opitutaceae bacterium]